MNAEELVAAVDELDQKLERLRVLYDQYFTGIEKIPPNVLQKDVDRRIWILRREKIRNTGTRFRFQQIIQRYNTLSSYWMRVLREIENGTYKRDVMRAKKRFGVDTKSARSIAAAASERPPPVADLDVSLDDIELETSFDDLDAIPSPVPSRPAAPPPPPRPVGIFPGSLRPPGPPPRPAQPAAAAEPAQANARPAPPASRAPERVTPATPAPAQKSAAPEAPRKVHPSVPRILATKVESDDDLDSMLDDALGPAARTAPKPQPRPSAPQPVSRPSAPQPVSRPSAPQPVSRPSAPQPVARPVAQQPVARPQPQATAARPPATGTDEYRRVYAQYVEAKRRNGESTAGITYDNLAKSLRDTTEKLKSKSGGKAIDFEVTTKDGKTILKPVVR